MLCTLAQRFRLSLPEDAEVRSEPLITLRPVLPPMIVERRERVPPLSRASAPD